MKKIVSVSLGSSKRNYSVELEVLGEKVYISRVGTDGDLGKMMQLIKQLDGEVDSIGLGGTDLYLQAGRKKYVILESLKFKKAIKKSFVTDGSLIKAVWEKKVVINLIEEGIISANSRVLVTTALDRYGIAEAFYNMGCSVVFGDFLFALNLPFPMRTLKAVNIAAAVLLPILTHLPIRMLYPVGKKQEEVKPRYEHFFHWAQVIAGDFHQIRRYAPFNLENKIILTNTITSEDVEMLRNRGVSLLITTTPLWEDRSFGTNVLEGLMVAFLGKPQEKITKEEVEEFLQKILIKPRIEKLN
ncbi:MAG: hypothetical protein DDT41_00089 [candidate division WS2 bacterium]|nr:hypothetical protein [Candidatus Psychracetigena formicireducens]